MRAISRGSLTVAALFIAVPSAMADGYVSPWAGVQFASSADNGRGAFGITAGSMGAGILGGEIDLGVSPRFFGSNNDFGHNTVIDVMGNVIVGIPIGKPSGAGVRPYVTGGLGLIHTHIEGGTVFPLSSSSNELGWDAGAGVMGYFSHHVGLRGDVRYFRNISGDVVVNPGGVIGSLDLGGLHFWRASVGLTFH